MGVAIGIALSVVGVIVLGVVMSAGSPASLGDSDIADAHDADCGAGNMSACDALYWESAIGSELEEFGSTCGGRTGGRDGGCVDAGIVPQVTPRRPHSAAARRAWHRRRD